MTQTAQTEKYPQLVTQNMVDEAILIALTITGQDGFGGVRSIDSQPGLVCLVQEYIDTAKETKGTDAIVYENRGTYWIGW